MGLKSLMGKTYASYKEDNTTDTDTENGIRTTTTNYLAGKSHSQDIRDCIREPEAKLDLKCHRELQIQNHVHISPASYDPHSLARRLTSLC